MILKELKVNNFRNYKSLDIFLNDKINIIYGNNAQGKTNILESIYVLGLTKSHRSFIDQDLIREGCENSKIIGTILKDNFETKYEIDLNKKKKSYKIDNNQVKKTSDYISNINIIIFQPNDSDLIISSPDIRRKYLNLELSQLYNNYYRVLNDYNKLLKIRNEFLKQKQKGIDIDNNYFDIITEYMIDKSIFIYRARNKFINKINNYVTKIYLEIMGLDGFKLKYKTNFNFEEFSEKEIKSKFRKKLEELKEAEIKLGSTLVGPNRDDFEFCIDNKNLKTYGSQGQQRIAIISLKLSEIEVFKNYLKTNPILLLDDVFSELDFEKKNNLLKYIKDDIQTIITSTDLANIDEEIISSSRVFKVVDGKIIMTKEEVEKHE